MTKTAQDLARRMLDLEAALPQSTPRQVARIKRSMEDTLSEARDLRIEGLVLTMYLQAGREGGR